ncbi:hypothetical protein [Maritimibacter fusiformis]|uniref:Cation/multidrug efflux pump n=1 Tax=Maritimibacter fusiformis TaxID=2603819 RepID=A0A5D0RM71_9RHOB|nr:hypothetical protein [Maritimibacter fusiformis]TYB82209.1 hypothetical protein FVF75_05635 [Maritimibacter fusiformis]
MGFIRLIIFGFLLLSVIYVAISIYSRSIRREKLEDRWAEEHPGDMESPERDAYIETGMTEYQNSIRPKLVLLVYIIPTIAVGLILYLTNAN